MPQSQRGLCLPTHFDGLCRILSATGADAGQICVWNMAPVAREEDELSESVPKLLCQMDNHLACVNCVRWSADGRHLASGGDDKVIMIWAIGRYGMSSSGMFGGGGKTNVEHWKCVSTLRGPLWRNPGCAERAHRLGERVSWDPVGNPTQELAVWRTHDWQQECMITDPFLECGGTTHILRLSWSPDGQYLVSAHAMNNAGPTAQIVERDNWRTNKDFVGHRKAVTCVRFNPHIRSKLNKDNSKNMWHQKLYGKSLSGPGSQQRPSGSTLIEDPEVLRAQEQYSRQQQQQQQKVAASTTKEVNGVASTGASPAASNAATSNAATGNAANSVVRPVNTNSNSSRPMPHIKGPIDKQIETRMPDGRRRITPLFIPPDPEVGDVPVPFNSQALPNFSSSTESKSRIVIEKRDESSSVPGTDLCDKSSERTPIVKAQKESAAKSSSAQQSVPASAPPRHQAMFPALKQSMPVTVKVPHGEDSKVMRSIQLQTDIPVPGSRTVSKVRCSEEESVFWEHLVSGRGVALAASNVITLSPLFPAAVVCVVCEDRTLTAPGSCLLALTTHGSLHVWDLARGVCTVREESVAPLFRDAPGATLRASSISQDGLPLLTLTTGRSYLFSRDMGAWLLLAGGGEDAVAHCSDHHASMPPTDGVRAATLPLGSLQHNMFRVPQRAKSVFHAGPSLQQAGTLSFLDGQVASSLALRSSSEYRFWTLTLARYLATEGLENRLKDLCTQLLGPLGGSSQSWEPAILGVDKRGLLKEVLPLLASNLRLQRLFTEFKEQLDTVTDESLPPNG
ncbi:hypothetical protein HPB48_019202 [Haemaphysalis longicornis]|uniref:Protein HIRA n=1 Tax=Haemaphysalis longicornis TaxID=44386 RepID=A0A9J6GP09_HAELO|nr:hypothetical protein HPB48_019202 [Haemaphysalis longicornis]